MTVARHLPSAWTKRAQAHRELDALVDRRREAGAPLPPGDCAPPPPVAADAPVLDM